MAGKDELDISDDVDVDVDDIDGDDIDESEISTSWSMKLVPNTSNEIPPPEIPGWAIHVTHACFGADVNQGSRTVVISKSETEVPICVLLEGKNENVKLNLLFSGPTTLVLKGKDPSPVSLTGYLQPPPIPDMEDSMIDDMEGVEDMDELDDIDEQDEVDILPKKNQLPQTKKQQLGKNKNDTIAQPKQGKKENNNNNNNNKNQQKNANNKKKNQDNDKESKKNEKMITMKNGIQYKDIKEGTGQQIKKGQKVSVYYVGQLKNQKVFDKVIKGKGFTFDFGKGSVIKGWELGMEGMKVGGKRQLIIPNKLGYGAQGSGPIPPNSDLIFTVEIKSAN